MKRHNYIVLVAALTLTIPNMVQAGFTALRNCGSAKVVSGDNCKNAKVELNFTGCAGKLPSQMASQVTCEGDVMKARYKNDTFLFEAQFKKQSDDWGGVTWNSLGKLKQWQKETPPVVWSAPKAEPVLVAEAAPAPETRAPAAAAAATSNLKVSGFVDLRLTSVKAEEDPSYAGADHAEGGFGFEDGAIYATYDVDNMSLVADMPVRRSYDKDEKAAGTTTTQSNTQNIRFGGDKAQLFLKYKLNDKVTFDLGQFDTIYGVELNDSKDRVFGTAGLVNANLMPVVHTGAMVEYASNGFGAKLFAANPNSRGTYGGTTTDDDQHIEYGVAASYANDTYHGQIGYMTRSMKNLNSETGSRNLLDVTAGAVFGNFSVDVEYASLTEPGKNIDSGSATDQEDPAIGLFALLSYKVSDQLMLGLRYESLKDTAYSTGVEKGDSYGLSVRSKVNANLEVRTEYITYAFDQTNGAGDFDNSRFNVASVFTF